MEVVPGTDDECICSFTPEVDLGWSLVDGVGKDGQIVLAYTEEDKLITLEAQDLIPVTGTLKCVLPVKNFIELGDNDMLVDFKGFEISTDEDPNPKSAYQRSIDSWNDGLYAVINRI